MNISCVGGGSDCNTCSMTVPSEAIINLYDKEKSVDETNIRIRPRKRKEMGLTYFIDLECMYWMGEED